MQKDLLKLLYEIARIIRQFVKREFLLYLFFRNFPKVTSYLFIATYSLYFPL